MDNKNSDLAVINNKFNEILTRHIKQLLHSHYDSFGLSFKLQELSCLVLIQEQIAAQADNFPVCLNNFSKEKLFDEVSDLGMESGAELDMAFEKLIAKEFICLDDDKHICVNKLTQSVTLLLDRIYPKMCGMNLVAYIIQTMDEVISGRKDLALALNQFDQTLQLHGVLLEQQKENQKHKKAGYPLLGTKNINYKKAESYTRDLSISSKNKFGTDNNSSIIRSGNLIKSIYSPFSEPGITPEPKKKEVKVIEEISFKDKENIEPGKNNSEESPIDLHAISPDEKLIKKEIIDNKKLNTRGSETTERINSEKSFEPDTESNIPKATGLKELPENKKIIIPTEIRNKMSDADALPVSDGTGVENNPLKSFESEDDIVENRIAAFEEELAMQCPICNSGKVISNLTLKNKEYFRCSNKQCSFISWGKPVYKSCPKCSNNFLIESILSNGQKVLRCPRATCHYTIDINGDIEHGTSDRYTSIIDKSGQKANPSQLPVKRAAGKRVVRRRK
ncbi:MAG: hypothetical protein WBN77_14755 [Desulfobacterales bacterium]